MNKELVRNALRVTVTAHRAHVRWLTWCDGLHTAEVSAGVFAEGYDRDLATSVQRAYTAAHKRPVMPSKNRKHRMYGDAYRVAALAGLEVRSISTLEEIADVIAQVTEALATA